MTLQENGIWLNDIALYSERPRVQEVVFVDDSGFLRMPVGWARKSWSPKNLLICGWKKEYLDWQAWKDTARQSGSGVLRSLALFNQGISCFSGHAVLRFIVIVFSGLACS